MTSRQYYHQTLKTLRKYDVLASDTLVHANKEIGDKKLDDLMVAFGLRILMDVIKDELQRIRQHRRARI